jgi:4-hydroxy-3-polyprenylbenzoate decarboxylase
MADPVVVGMTGATGQIYGIQALDLLQETDHEVHLILSDASKINIKQESDYTVSDVQGRADVVHDNRDMGAPPASGSFLTEGMVVTPCSMKTLSNVANGDTGSLISRSADVMLKERRPLVLMPREKPFNKIHLENMLSVTEANAIVFPPFPSFYQNPASISEMVERTMIRALTHVNVDLEYDQWQGLDSAE